MKVNAGDTDSLFKKGFTGNTFNLEKINFDINIDVTKIFRFRDMTSFQKGC